ncbi:hypothetical protein M0R45_005596 [Rubus argutus]|uniref:Uncharacterized protein n=1 Tax=Rubus argutus TaxID=59490 RepID=A0AAW1YNF5_RUBAR
MECEQVDSMKQLKKTLIYIYVYEDNIIAALFVHQGLEANTALFNKTIDRNNNGSSEYLLIRAFNFQECYTNQEQESGNTRLRLLQVSEKRRVSRKRVKAVIMCLSRDSLKE